MRKIFLIVVLFSFLVSCGSTKDAFTLKKKSSADEFLVEKKSPLVLPPDYGKLPLPGNAEINDTPSDEDNIKNLLSNDKKSKSSNNKSSDTISIKESILEKIK